MEALMTSLQIPGGGGGLSKAAAGAMIDSSPEAWLLVGASLAVRGDAVVILLIHAWDQRGGVLCW